MKRPETLPAVENYDYYNGDHWPHWIGPKVPDKDPRAKELMSEVERVFQSINLIRECCDRHVAALIGKFPVWYIKGADGKRIPTKNEQGEALDTPAARAEIDLQRWLDAVMQRSDAGVTAQGDPFWQAVTDLSVVGNASLRLWQPSRFAEDPDPIKRIHLHSPKLGSVSVKRGDDEFVDEISYSYGAGYQEVETMDGDTLTVTTKKGGAAEGEPIEIDTGGRWTIAVMRSPSLLTPQIRQNQDAINHAATMLLRNQEQAGFLERIFLNAQPPGKWVKDETALEGERFEPDEEGLAHGPGQDVFLMGVPTGDRSNPSYSNAGVAFRDPVNPATFLDSIRGFRGYVYHAFGQGHLLIEGDGSMSGVSRIQLRQDFEVILTRQKRVIEAAIASILNIVLRILEYTDLEVVVQLRVSTGKLSPEERKGVMEEYSQGLLSKATAIALLGSVDDVDAELAMIEEERQKQTQRRSPLTDPFETGGGNGG